MHKIDWPPRAGVRHIRGPQVAEAAMTQSNNTRRALQGAFASAFILGAIAPTLALADEGGVSFWQPGFFGSLAATAGMVGGEHLLSYHRVRERNCADCP
jgi:hypothetical protein